MASGTRPSLCSWCASRSSASSATSVKIHSTRVSGRHLVYTTANCVGIQYDAADNGGTVPRIRLWSWLLLLGVSAAQAADLPQIAPPDDATLFASPTRKDRIGRILVPVMINGQGPFRLIVDTGASYSTISPQLAQTLGLQASDEYPFLVNGVTGSARAPSVPIDLLEAGDLRFRSLRLPVIEPGIMAGADGIL